MELMAAVNMLQRLFCVTPESLHELTRALALAPLPKVGTRQQAGAGSPIPTELVV